MNDIHTKIRETVYALQEIDEHIDREAKLILQKLLFYGSMHLNENGETQIEIFPKDDRGEDLVRPEPLLRLFTECMRDVYEWEKKDTMLQLQKDLKQMLSLCERTLKNWDSKISFDEWE